MPIRSSQPSTRRWVARASSRARWHCIPMTSSARRTGCSRSPSSARSACRRASAGAGIPPPPRLAFMGTYILATDGPHDGSPPEPVRRLPVRGLLRRGRFVDPAPSRQRGAHRTGRPRRGRTRCSTSPRRSERARLSRDLHAGALATLEELRAGWSTDRARARTLARRESIRLRRAIRGDDTGTELDLTRRLEDIARDLADSGMRCDLILDDLDHDPNEETAAAIADAVRAALDNAVTHAGVNHSVVRVAEFDEGIEVTVRDPRSRLRRVPTVRPRSRARCAASAASRSGGRSPGAAPGWCFGSRDERARARRPQRDPAPRPHDGGRGRREPDLRARADHRDHTVDPPSSASSRRARGRGCRTGRAVGVGRAARMAARLDSRPNARHERRGHAVRGARGRGRELGGTRRFPPKRAGRRRSARC